MILLNKDVSKTYFTASYNNQIPSSLPPNTVNTVRDPSLLDKLLRRDRLPAPLTNETVRMPMLVQGGVDGGVDHLATGGTLLAVEGPVVIGAVRLPCHHVEPALPDGGAALGAGEVVHVPRSAHRCQHCVGDGLAAVSAGLQCV